MILSGVGNPYRKDTEYVTRGFGQSGRDIARLKLNKPVNQESALSNVLFGLFITGTTFMMIWIVWRGMSGMFMQIWNQLASR